MHLQHNHHCYWPLYAFVITITILVARCESEKESSHIANGRRVNFRLNVNPRKLEAFAADDHNHDLNSEPHRRHHRRHHHQRLINLRIFEHISKTKREDAIQYNLAQHNRNNHENEQHKVEHKINDTASNRFTQGSTRNVIDSSVRASTDPDHQKIRSSLLTTTTKPPLTKKSFYDNRNNKNRKDGDRNSSRNSKNSTNIPNISRKNKDEDVQSTTLIPLSGFGLGDGFGDHPTR